MCALAEGQEIGCNWCADYLPQRLNKDLQTKQCFVNNLCTKQCFVNNLCTKRCLVNNLCTKQCFVNNFCTKRCLVNNLCTKQCLVNNLFTKQCLVNNFCTKHWCMHGHCTVASSKQSEDVQSYWTPHKTLHMGVENVLHVNKMYYQSNILLHK